MTAVGFEAGPAAFEMVCGEHNDFYDLLHIMDQMLLKLDDKAGTCSFFVKQGHE